MDQKASIQLEKIIAMADSSHDGEAIIALRKARQLLAQDGLSFGDLACAASRRSHSPFALFAGGHAQLETKAIQLRQQLQDTQTDAQVLTAQLEFWRRRAMELEQRFNLSQSEAQRWHQLARNTAEKLWDMGQQIQIEDVAADPSADPNATETPAPLKMAAGGK